MTSLAGAAQDYLTVRRALGYKLERTEKLLGLFVAHCDQAGVTTVTTEAAVTWATLPAGASPGWLGARLTVVRGFATWLQTLDPATEVPPADVIGPTPVRRAVPYPYTDADIIGLMDAAVHLRYPLAQATYRALVGLLAVTGIRIGEAIRLDRGDIDTSLGVLRVNHSKFNKSREVPLHQSTVNALVVYAEQRDRLCSRPVTPAFLLSSNGTRLIHCNVSRHYNTMARHAGLVPITARCRPRIHDLRHAFAVATLVEWHRAGVEVQARLPQLSTLLGHVDPKSTYWYLTATPALLASAADRLDPASQDRT